MKMTELDTQQETAYCSIRLSAMFGLLTKRGRGITFTSVINLGGLPK